jgi:hypothetical protein
MAAVGGGDSARRRELKKTLFRDADDPREGFRRFYHRVLMTGNVFSGSDLAP